MLKEFGALLERLADAASAGAFGARLGGEEFVLVMPDRAPAGALDAVEALRRAVEQHHWPEMPNAAGPTVSAGLVIATAGDKSLSELLAEADARLYAAKRAGRNRIDAVGERTD